jgi:hypothetical protein
MAFRSKEELYKKKKMNRIDVIRTGVSGVWAGSPCSKPAYPQLA